MSAPAPIADASVYGDFAGLDALRRNARNHDPAAIREVAKQFESLFARMLIKSMRNAVGRDPIFGSDQVDAYQSMFDDQLSLELTKGHGLGLADMLVRQLQRTSVPGASIPPSGNSSASGAAAGAAAVHRGTAAVSAAHSAPASAAQRKQFISDVWPQAQQAGAALGVDPAGLIAQAALESDWGRSVPRGANGQSSHNLFGIKAGAGWSGAAVTAQTQEIEQGSPVSTAASFRAYGSPAESFGNYVALLKSSPRYAAALDTGGDVQAFAAALQRGGYATDPDYARKVSAIASQVTRTANEPLKFASALPIPGDAGELL
ncbi:MAG: flagellar assembly peptidoglycan hydrolase FlgJ [Steroidobacteraceae bacterium]